MIFNAPWFALLFPLPLLFRWLFPAVKPVAEENMAIYFPALNRLKTAFLGSSTPKPYSQKVLLTLLFVSWTLFVFALMQPEKIDRFTQVKAEGYDLMLAVDVSGSMEAVDMSTGSKPISRLDATKEVVGKFVKGRQGDRVGLITFGENAYLHVPLTLDTLAVGKMLDMTVAGMAGNATAIGDAIGLAVRTLRDRPQGSRVLVLLTDGEDNASSIPPLEAAKLAKQYGIKIYTIGVGKKGAVPFPTNFGYRMVTASIDEKLLKEIAEMTEGYYFSASDKNSLEAVYAEINVLEKTKSNESVVILREPLYRYPLVFSALCLLTALLWQISGRRWANGF